MCCNASLHDFQWGLYKQVWVCGNNGKKDVWQSILPHILPQRKSLNDSFTLRIRWEFVGLDPNEISTKFQRFALWQNVVAKQTNISLKCLCFSISGVWQNVLSQHFCTKKNSGISWKFRWESAQTHEILTKQNRQNPVIQGLIANGQISG